VGCSHMCVAARIHIWAAAQSAHAVRLIPLGTRSQCNYNSDRMRVTHGSRHGLRAGENRPGLSPSAAALARARTAHCSERRRRLCPPMVYAVENMMLNVCDVGAPSYPAVVRLRLIVVRTCGAAVVDNMLRRVGAWLERPRIPRALCDQTSCSYLGRYVLTATRVVRGGEGVKTDIQTERLGRSRPRRRVVRAWSLALES